MGKILQKILFILLGFSIVLGFFVEHDPVVFWWHHIPSLDVIVGGAGAVLLMMGMKALASFVSKREDFYD